MIDYGILVNDAMRSVVEKALLEVKKGCECHIYITVDTTYPGVSLAHSLMDAFPAEMTIVLHNKFLDLDVSDGIFAVTLSFFGGEHHRIEVPIAAVTKFLDMDANFEVVLETPSVNSSNFDNSDDVTLDNEDNVLSFLDFSKNNPKNR